MAASSSFTTLQAARALWFSSRLHGVEVVGRSGMPRAMACFRRPRWRQVDRVGVAGNVLRHVSTLTCPEDQRKYVGGQGCGSRLFFGGVSKPVQKGTPRVPVAWYLRRRQVLRLQESEEQSAMRGMEPVTCISR